MKKTAALIVVLAGTLLMVSCGGSTAELLPPPPVTIVISPGSVTVDQGSTTQYQATLTGTSNTGVTWTVQEGSAGGTITVNGLYTAPASAGTFHVVATSVADSTKHTSSEVIVLSVHVAVSPDTGTMDQGATQQYTAVVTGTTNKLVAWSLQEGPTAGALTPDGLYTAPSYAGSYHVIATSQANPTVSASASITVATVSLSISPGEITLARNALQAFSVNVAGTVNKSVLWAVQENTGGSITAGGTYTAPASGGTFHVVASSSADPSKTSSATVYVQLGAFRATGSMLTPRRFHSATLLPNGEVLVAGGRTTGDFGGPPLASAEIFNPQSETFRATGSMSLPRSSHTATVLLDGRVLVVGGHESMAEIYDPATGTFATAGATNIGWVPFTATLLPDGRVLLIGGAQGYDPLAEVYDPATGLFTAATGGEILLAYGSSPILSDITAHTATLLDDGSLLIVGGLTSECESWGARYAHTATLLNDGRVLLAGGGGDTSAACSGHGAISDDAEIYESASGFGLPFPMSAPRTQHSATLLPNGQVLLAGGMSTGQYGEDTGASSAEVFEPLTAAFLRTGSMSLPRVGHTATRLPNGAILVTGGGTDIFVGATTSAEIYEQ